MKDPYQVLGIGYDATDTEVKRAYHALARRYHPDGFADDSVKLEMANRKMRDINAAYEQIVADRARGIRGAAAYAGATPYEEPTPPRADTEEKKEKKEKPEKKKEKKKEKKSRKSESERESPRYRPRDGRDEQEARFGGYPYVRTLIETDCSAAALGELFRIREENRTAEWHYLAGRAHHALHHLHDALREVNLACRMAPKNEEYKRTRAEMKTAASGFADRCEKNRPKGGGIKVEGKKKNDDPCKRCCFCSLGIEDGKC